MAQHPSIMLVRARFRGSEDVLTRSPAMVLRWEPARLAESLRLRLNSPSRHFSGPEKRPEKRCGLETAPVITEIMSRCASETQ